MSVRWKIMKLGYTDGYSRSVRTKTEFKLVEGNIYNLNIAQEKIKEYRRLEPRETFGIFPE